MAEVVDKEVTPDDKKVEDVTDDFSAPNIEDDNEPLLEPEGLPEPDKKVHPLTPGGKRFEQIYAESRQARRELAIEHDLRVAAEAKLEAASIKPVTENATETEYSRAQLEDFIQQGRITRADAEAHREAVMAKKIATQIKSDFLRESTAVNRGQALSKEIEVYLQSVPTIRVEGSEDRAKVDEEFAFAASIQGVDPNKIDDVTRKALQLTALRTVYGPVSNLVKTELKTETHQGLPGGVRPRPVVNADQALLDKLSKAEVVHYNKMMRAGRYPGGWKDVVAELKYVPKRGK